MTKRDKCLKRDNYQCVKCGAKDSLTLDHIIPKAKGGKDWLINLQILCQKCNCEKGSDIVIYSKGIGNRLDKHIRGLK